MMAIQNLPPRPSHAPAGLLEMGTNSLKFYRIGGAVDGIRTVETYKFPWRVGHSFYAHRRLDDVNVREITDRIRKVEQVASGIPLAEIGAVATGVFREIPEFDAIARRIRIQTGVRVELISGATEAELLALGLREHRFEEPAALFDLGGSTTEWVWIDRGRQLDCGSLPLGAIRNRYAHAHLRNAHADYLAAASDDCDRALRGLPFSGSVNPIATGGTAKAAAAVLGSYVVTLRQVRELAVRVLEHGPPPELKESRRTIFLPGLIILWRIMLRCGADHFRYGEGAMRHGLVLKLLRTSSSNTGRQS